VAGHYRSCVNLSQNSSPHHKITTCNILYSYRSISVKSGSLYCRSLGYRMHAYFPTSPTLHCYINIWKLPRFPLTNVHGLKNVLLLAVKSYGCVVDERGLVSSVLQSCEPLFHWIVSTLTRVVMSVSELWHFIHRTLANCVRCRRTDLGIFREVDITKKDTGKNFKYGLCIL